MEGKGGGEMPRIQAEMWQLMYGHIDSMLLKCAVELRIADIIHSHGGPITLSQIASSISDSTSPNIHYLKRIMRFLVHKKIFTAHHDQDSSSSDGVDHHQTRYGLTPKSRVLLWESKPSWAPFIMIHNQRLLVEVLYHLSDCVRDGVVPYEKAYGHEFYGDLTADPKMNKWFNDGVASLAKIVMGPVLSAYKEGFDDIGSLVDVGGGIGAAIYEISRSHPHIKCFNFDLPHVVATAPSCDGVTHVTGDMFEAIPKADAIFMKLVLNNWSEEHCVKILRNCRSSIPERTGKVIIVDIVLESSESNEDDDVDTLFDEMRLRHDLAVMAFRSAGKERTELEWKKLLAESGFPRYKITKIPAVPSIIEAFPI